MLIDNQYIFPRAINSLALCYGLWLIGFSWWFFKQKKYRLLEIKTFVLAAFTFYLATVAKLTLMPIYVYRFWRIKDYFGKFGNQTDIIHLNPTSMFAYFPSHFWIYQFFGNLIMLIPFGFMINYIYPKVNSALKATLAGFLLSLSIETYQLILSYFYLTNRYFETSDLILNTTGALIGFLIWQVIKKIPWINKQLRV